MFTFGFSFIIASVSCLTNSLNVILMHKANLYIRIDFDEFDFEVAIGHKPMMIIHTVLMGMKFYLMIKPLVILFRSYGKIFIRC